MKINVEPENGKNVCLYIVLCTRTCSSRSKKQNTVPFKYKLWKSNFTHVQRGEQKGCPYIRPSIFDITKLVQCVTHFLFVLILRLQNIQFSVWVVNGRRKRKRKINTFVPRFMVLDGSCAESLWKFCSNLKFRVVPHSNKIVIGSKPLTPHGEDVKMWPREERIHIKWCS